MKLEWTEWLLRQILSCEKRQRGRGDRPQLLGRSTATSFCPSCPISTPVNALNSSETSHKNATNKMLGPGSTLGANAFGAVDFTFKPIQVCLAFVVEYCQTYKICRSFVAKAEVLWQRFQIYLAFCTKKGMVSPLRRIWCSLMASVQCLTWIALLTFFLLLAALQAMGDKRNFFSAFSTNGTRLWRGACEGQALRHWGMFKQKLRESIAANCLSIYFASVRLLSTKSCVSLAKTFSTICVRSKLNMYRLRHTIQRRLFCPTGDILWIGWVMLESNVDCITRQYMLAYSFWTKYFGLGTFPERDGNSWRLPVLALLPNTKRRRNTVHQFQSSCDWQNLAKWVTHLFLSGKEK